MTAQPHRPLGILLALVLTASFWVPTLSSPAAATVPVANDQLVYAGPSSLVLM